MYLYMSVIIKCGVVMNYIFSKELYSKKALLCAAYRFTDDFYVHLSADEHNYSVDLLSKTGKSHLTYDDFQNELLSQTVRENVFNETKDLRTLMMARAFSTSIIDSSDNTKSEITAMEEENSIMEDWFEQNK